MHYSIEVKLIENLFLYFPLSPTLLLHGMKQINLCESLNE